MPYGQEDQYTGQEAQEWEILQQNMPNASDEEKSQAFQQYKEQKHWAEREGEDYTIYDHLQGQGIDTNQNLPPDVQGRMQQGRQAGQPEMMQEMPTSLMQQSDASQYPKPSPEELEAMKNTMRSTMYGTLGGGGSRGIRKPY